VMASSYLHETDHMSKDSIISQPDSLLGHEWLLKEKHLRQNRKVKEEKLEFKSTDTIGLTSGYSNRTDLCANMANLNRRRDQDIEKLEVLSKRDSV